jgi:L-rhamnose mutarotase
LPCPDNEDFWFWLKSEEVKDFSARHETAWPEILTVHHED